MSLTETIRTIASLNGELAAHEAEAKIRADGLRTKIAELKRQVAIDGAQLDGAKIDLARTIIRIRGAYARAGQDKASVIQDAISFFANGPRPYKDLGAGYFGTKNYDGWSGQRSDHPYGYGPTHGSICFAVELAKPARRWADFTAEETEACLYFLTRLEAIQTAEAAVKQTA